MHKILLLFIKLNYIFALKEKPQYFQITVILISSIFLSLGHTILIVSFTAQYLEASLQ